MLPVFFQKTLFTCFLQAQALSRSHRHLILIDELNIRVTPETYNKLFYYLFRDFIGMNELDPMLRDYFIEDVECNGVDTRCM